MLRRPLATLALLSALQSGGCNLPQGPQDPENTAPPVNALDDPAHPGIEACVTGDVEAELQIARDFEDSCHEMVICGGLSAAFTITLVEVLVNAASGNSTSPSGFVYTGQGRYLAGTQMQLTLRLAKDTSFGKAGDVIDFDLFNLANYFTHATIEASASVSTSGKAKTSLSIEFEGTGNAFELLGLEAGADGKIQTDLQTIAKNLGASILIESKIWMNDERESSTISYELDSPATLLAQFLESGPMDMQLVKVTGSASTGQSIVMKNWAMQYKASSSSGTLDGSIDFEVRGGAFDYVAKFTYPHRKEPDVALGCAQ
ncbi:MAG: hypothetical protein HS104_27590 [Polyangiaceae bacterium]|nr:hypothetical protein [Polyangiaceae bacterium]MCL4751813.1 hypothetical protein [Myxococcales bacterium]